MEGQLLELESGNVKPFLAKGKSGLLLLEGTGTLTLSYSLDGSNWDDDDKTYTIPQSGYVNIETYFVPFCWYKVTTTGALTQARIKYSPY